MIRLIKIVEDTMVDGPGMRTSIYCAGCSHACLGCHNPQTWDFHAGRDASTQEILDVIMADPFANVTFTGGDPFYQADGFTELARAIKQNSTKTIWCYTGFVFEELLQNAKHLALLKTLDVLVDGPFIQALRNTDLTFRGSSNQRIIDVQASLHSGTSIVLDLDRTIHEL